MCLEIKVCDLWGQVSDKDGVICPARQLSEGLLYHLSYAVATQQSCEWGRLTIHTTLSNTKLCPVEAEHLFCLGNQFPVTFL